MKISQQYILAPRFRSVIRMWGMKRLRPILLLLVIACTPESTVTGVWEGPIRLTGPGPTGGNGGVQLVVQSHDHRLRGSFIWANGTQDLEPLSNVPFEIAEGVATDEEVFFVANRLLPNGDARIRLDGTIRGDRLEAEIEIRVTSTRGETIQTGRVDLRRVDTDADA